MLQNTLILILLIWSMNVIIFVHNYVCVKLFLEVEIDIIIPQLPCTMEKFQNFLLVFREFMFR